MANSVFYIWFFVNVLLLIYIIQECILLFSAIRSKKKIDRPTVKTYPKVTIQLPIYNEPFVVERLIKSCLNIDYPEGLLEIQILDDSIDQSSAIIENFLKDEKSLKYSIQHIRRDDRIGYKAGALAVGLETAKGEFIAIFDADFLPNPDFLFQTIPHFNDPIVGVVQTRWGHLNESNSLLTRAQAIMLNTHFSVEQLGRTANNSFINFNGTAGVWRKSCIETSGGWKADTLTEDLDLSYRAQMANWKFTYLFDVEAPAELPATFDSYRTQQYRWSKGAAECVRKNWDQLWVSKSSFKAKLFGSFHLLNSSIYFLVFLLLLLSPLVYYFGATKQINVSNFQGLSLIGSLVSLLLLLIFFGGYFLVRKTTLKGVLWFFPSIITFFTMTSGISIYMASGVVDGYLGKASPFIRTPKLGDSKVKSDDNSKKMSSKLILIRLLESIGFLYGGFLLFKGIESSNIMVGIYGFLLFAGFSLSLFFSKLTWRWEK